MHMVFFISFRAGHILPSDVIRSLLFVFQCGGHLVEVIQTESGNVGLLQALGFQAKSLDFSKLVTQDE